VLNYLSQNSLFIVLIIVLVVWLGIFFFLLRMDSRIKKLETNSEKH